MEWIDQLKVNREIESAVARVDVRPSEIAAVVAELRQAAGRYAPRRDSFAEGKAEICLDIASKVERFGSFASVKQREFADKLIAWSKPREGGVKFAEPKGPLEVPKLFGVMQKHAHFHAAPLKLSRKNQDTLVWIMFGGVCVGKIEDARVSLFARRLGADEPKVVALLAEFEADPLEAAKKYGKLSGRCCSCGRDLTDPASIEAGIGPVCAQRFN